MGSTQVIWPADAEADVDAPGPPVLRLAPALAITVLGLDVALGRDVGLLFELGFITVCLGLGMLAEPPDLFLAAVTPPLMMLGCLVAVGVLLPEAFGVPSAGAVTGIVAGFAHHSWALGVGYLLCLAGLGTRLVTTRGS